MSKIHSKKRDHSLSEIEQLLCLHHDESFLTQETHCDSSDCCLLMAQYPERKQGHDYYSTRLVFVLGNIQESSYWK